MTLTMMCPLTAILSPGPTLTGAGVHLRPDGHLYPNAVALTWADTITYPGLGCWEKDLVFIEMVEKTPSLEGGGESDTCATQGRKHDRHYTQSVYTPLD